MPHQKRTPSGVLGGVLGLVGLSAVAGVLITAAVTPALAVSGFAASSAISAFDDMPGYLKIQKLMLPTEIYAESDGKQKLLTEFYDQNRIPLKWDEVAPVMYDAILSSEDKNFYTHGGVDLLGTISAMKGNLTGGSSRGGSSITQQYVKNVLQQTCEAKAKTPKAVRKCFDETTASKGAKGIQRKLQEMRYAMELEKEYSKHDILLGYLNIASFGGSVYGVGAAAEYYFGVSAKDLTIGQAATLAGMVQEPNGFRFDLPKGSIKTKAGAWINSAKDNYSQTKLRQEYVLNRMLKDTKITQAEFDKAMKAKITPKITPRPQGCERAVGAEWFCDYVRSVIVTDKAFGASLDDRLATLRRGGLKIYTTLDTTLQAAAVKAMKVVPSSVSYMDLGSSAIQVQVGTGRVLSMVQNRKYSQNGAQLKDPSYTSVNYNVREQNGGGIGHPAGSTYKLFSVINWLQQGHSINEYLNGKVGVKHVINCDGQTQTVVAGNGNGMVNNFQNNRGYVGSVYKFTSDSLNSGFLTMAEKISVCSTNRVAGEMGVTWGDGTPLDEFPGNGGTPNTAYQVLGSSAVAPIDMAAAYASVANEGTWCSPTVIDKVLNADGSDHAAPKTTCKRVMSQAVAATAAYTLVGVMSGTGIGARTYDGTPIFGKTGIHEYEHTWMDGSSTKVTSVVWVGNVVGTKKLNNYYANGWQLSKIRNSVWPNIQRAADAKYGGGKFPTPDKAMTQKSYVTLPSVVGYSTAQAQSRLQSYGFTVAVGPQVDSVEPAGTIVSQSPGAGRVVAGTTIVISPSNGEGTTVPGVAGTPDQAKATLSAAGFTKIDTKCTASGEKDDKGKPTPGQVTGTTPAAGAMTSKSAKITVNYTSSSCS